MNPSESVNYKDPHRSRNDRSDEFFHQSPLSPHDNSFGQRHHVSLPSYHAREDQFQSKESSVWPRNDRDDYGKRNSRDYSPKYGRRSPNRYSEREHKSPYRRRQSPSPRKPSHYSAEGHRHRDQQYDRRAGYRKHSSSRSRSGSYSKRHYRRSRSPQRQSRLRDRSSSYDSRKRYHKSSSSSTSGPSVRRSRSSSQDRKPKDDFFKSIYPQDESREENRVNIHQSFNTEKQLPMPAHDQYQNDNDNNFSNSALVKPLNQGYVKSSAKKGFGVTDELDDDDRFLYGDDVSTTNMNKNQDPVIQKLPVEVVPPKSQTTASKVTPGGFDSNALKNVLKAIGFDFEMSAQQSKNEEVVESVQVQQKAIPDEPKSSQISAPQPVPAAVPAIQPSINAPPQPVQYYQPYNPYTSAEYISQQPFAHIHAVNSGFPMSIQNPANPPGNFLIYHSLNTQSSSQQPPVQQIYTPQEPRSNLTIIQPQVPVNAFKEAGVTPRVVLPSKENASTPSIAKDGRDRQARKERLKYLENELDKLKKQQNELMRKKRREKDGHKDPLIKKNTLLQAGVEEQIREIRKAGIEDESDDGKEAHEISSDSNTVYFDPGNHWCKLCNIVLTDLKDFLAHLHSKMHRKAVDPYDRPWMELEEKSVPKSEENSSSQSLKGSQFLIPITGYFCVLCKTFAGDPMCAEDHCRSHKHNASYKDYSQSNENYEDQFKKLKSCSTSFNGKQEIQEQVQDEDQDKKVTKKKTKKHKHKKELIIEERKKVKIEKRKIEHQHKSYIEEETVKQLPKRYRDSPELKLTPNPDSRDRRRNCWSPGYDEYESRKKEHSHGKYSSDEEVTSRSREGRFGTYKRSKRDQHHRTHEKRSDDRRSQSREQENKWVEKKIDFQGNEEMLPKELGKTSSKLPTPGFGKFSWASSSTGESNSVFDQVPVDNEVKREKATDNSAGKEKFAIKMTGKSQTFPPRSTSSKKKEEKVFQKKKADLLKRVESLKRENALRAQLSAITLPAGRFPRPQVKPNTTAILLGSRNIQKPGVSILKAKSPTTRNNKEQPAKPVLNHPLLGNSNDEEVIITKEIEVDVSPSNEEKKEPPPPGEGEDMIGEDGAASDASGISMEIASDEE